MTTFEGDIEELESTYSFYKFLYIHISWMRVVPMKSEGEVIRYLVSSWPRDRAIKVYKHHYLKELQALRERASAAPSLDALVVDRSASMGDGGTSFSEDAAGVGIGTQTDSPTHIFEFSFFAGPPVPPNATELDLNQLLDYCGNSGITRN
jgi:hypothetical protein